MADASATGRPEHSSIFASQILVASSVVTSFSVGFSLLAMDHARYPFNILVVASAIACMPIIVSPFSTLAIAFAFVIFAIVRLNLYLWLRRGRTNEWQLKCELLPLLMVRGPLKN